MTNQCIICKGSDPLKYCNRTFCPILIKSNAIFKIKETIKSTDFTGQSPTPFVGRFGYPNINLGILTPPEVTENVELYDAPLKWSSSNYNISQVVELRSNLLNTRMSVGVKESSKFIDISKEVAMASKPAELEFNLKEKPFFKFNADSTSAPTGPNAKLDNVKLTTNPHISKQVENVFSDTDLKATEGITSLYSKGYDENFLSRILSVGVLGMKKDRKLVPTRWSITATDDIIGKNIRKQIRDYKFDDYKVFFNSYLGNYYIILFFPASFSYELFETYLPNASWNQSAKASFVTDYESCFGRKDYASNTEGGYYATKIAILEKLLNSKKQASVLALRFITDEYSVPLGVWVVREASRKTMTSSPISFSSKELMLSYIKNLVKTKFNYDLSEILSKSILLKNLNTQKMITDY